MHRHVTIFDTIPSRRSVLGASAIGAVALVGAAAIPGVSSAAKVKLAPTDIGYQNHPNGAQRCDTCSNWRPPSACELVAGAISPSGWCGLFKPKA